MGLGRALTAEVRDDQRRVGDASCLFHLIPLTGRTKETGTACSRSNRVDWSPRQADSRRRIVIADGRSQDRREKSPALDTAVAAAAKTASPTAMADTMAFAMATAAGPLRCPQWATPPSPPRHPFGGNLTRDRFGRTQFAALNPGQTKASRARQSRRPPRPPQGCAWGSLSGS